MLPEKKLEIALRLYYSARELKAAALRAQNPEWNEDRIQNTLQKIFLNVRT
jgi:hypothetical protein